MITNPDIQNYQKKTWANYKKQIGLTDDYTYLYGNPIKVHVPIDTATDGLMIIGAYPTAHFNVIKSIRDVPVEDHLYPFSNKMYFDGSSVNCVKSGKEIEDYFLKTLNLKREDCWITDLVKVFLLKEGHIKKYEQLGYHNFKETRSMFKTYAQASKTFIDDEILLAKPQIIIGLGEEVNSIMLNTPRANANKQMFQSEICLYTIGDTSFKYAPVAHPGILMRNSEQSLKWKKALDISLEKIMEFL